MSSRMQLALLALAAGVLALLWNAVYVVDADHQAVVMRFGRPDAAVGAAGAGDPGVKLKWPFVDRVLQLDRRDQPLGADGSVVTQDQHPLDFQGVMRFRIVDPLRFYRALGDADSAQARLRALLISTLRGVLQQASAQDASSDRRDALERSARDELGAAAAKAGFGIDVLGVELSQAAPAPAQAEQVFARMKADLQRQAEALRADTEVRREAATAEADKAAQFIRGEANANLARVRGEGEAQRNDILNAAYGRDPAFAAFLRSMRAYQQALGQGDTVFVLSPGSPFLHAMQEDAPSAGVPALRSSAAPRPPADRAPTHGPPTAAAPAPVQSGANASRR